jgi:cell fate regulator YaaT (PSP1 superfamily)
MRTVALGVFIQLVLLASRSTSIERHRSACSGFVFNTPENEGLSTFRATRMLLYSTARIGLEAGRLIFKQSREFPMPKYVVRYGTMRSLGVMSSRGGDRHGRGTQVVARTNRGMEVGEVLCEATEHAVASLKKPSHGQILRAMSADDLNEAFHIRAQEPDEFETCKKIVAELKLGMELVDMEHLFGGERIVIYYLAEERIDFRDLVKRLASEFQTRIEMRQIGVRDEAKLLADYGDCGKPVCCNTHLDDMPPVSMKMAKMQKATLDPTKISGRCGRLKCCLRYEYDTYNEMRKELPPIGADVITGNGRARILGHEILTQQLLIQTEDHRRMMIDSTEVLTVLKKEKKN